MRPTHPRPIALAAAAALVLTASACSGGGGETGADQPVDLTMTVWTADETIIATYQTLAEEFREDNPELGELTIQTIPFEEYAAQLTIQLSGGEAPDLGWVVESATPAFVDSGALHDVGALRDDPAWAADDLVSGLFSALEGPDGELYGYPFAGTTHPVIYNATAFEQAGVTTPLELFEAGEWTWESLRRVAGELVDAGVVTYGFDIPQFGFSSYALFTPFMKGFGAEAWPGGTECGYASAESVATFQFVHDMIYEDASYPGPGNTSSFPTGDTGMFLAAPSILSTLTDIDFQFEMVPQPSGSNGFDPFLGQASMVVFSAGADPDLATRLLGHLTSADGSAALQSFYVPPRHSLLTADRVAQMNPLLTEDAAQRSLIDTLEVAEQIDYPVAFPQLESTIRPVLDAAWQPGADVEATLRAACEAAQPILDGQ